MKYDIRPSKQLTDLLSKYLDFDSKQLKFGLWGGDLKIQDVNLKNDAFTPLLNTWKEAAGDAGLDIASFLSKEFLVDKDPSFASTLDLKLEKGTIGYCRAKIPWTNLLLKAGDETVLIDLRDVTIRLGLESCIAKLLAADGGPFSKLSGKHSGRVKFGKLQSNERRWKQEMIRIAEQCIAEGKDIPSPAEFSILKNEFLKEEKVDEQYNADEELKASILERFVKPLASSLGWRVGMGLKVTLQNFRITMIHDGVEATLHTELVELFEHSPNDSESIGVSLDASISPLKRWESTGTVATQDTTQEGNAIRKHVKVTNFGVFLREVPGESNDADNAETSLDEFIVQPTTANIFLCLRETGISVKVEDRDEETLQTQSTEESTIIDMTPVNKKQRRGKRDKKRKLNDDDGSESCSTFQSESNSIPISNYGMSKENYGQSIGSNGPQDSLDGIDLEESSALFSTKIWLDNITIVTTNRSLELINRFWSRMVKIKGGRPCGDLSKLLHGSIERKQLSRQLLLYACYCVLKDVRRRRKLIEYFYKSGDGFIPSAQRPFRQKYIECYAQNVLKRQASLNINDDTEGLHNEFLQRMEDSLTVEQIILYRDLARRKGTSDNSSHKVQFDTKAIMARHRSGFSFDSDARLDIISRPKHRSTHSLYSMRGLSQGSLNACKAPKHQRNQSLNIDTMNEALDHIPSARQLRYALDLSAIAESKSFEGNGAKDNFEAMHQFDKVMMQQNRYGKTNREKREPSTTSNNIGTVSSSAKLILSEIKFFHCQDTNEEHVEDNNLNDEVSILTASTFGDATKQNSCDDQINTLNRGLIIFGSPHKIVYSATLLEARISSHKNFGEESKVTNFSADGVYCRFREDDVLLAGNVQRPSIQDTLSVLGLIEEDLQSIGDLCDLRICQKIRDKVPFIRCELSHKFQKNSLPPKELRMSIAMIHLFTDTHSIKEVMDCIMHSKAKTHNFAKMCESDHVRSRVSKYLARNNIQGGNFDLQADFEGFEFNFLVKSDIKTDLYLEDTAEENNLIIARVGNIMLRHGILFDEVTDEKLYANSIPPDSSANFKTRLIFKDLSLLYDRDMTLFEAPLYGELLLSRTNNSSWAKSDESLMIMLSPMSIILSQHLMQTASSLVSIFQTEKSMNTNDDKFVRGYVPRLSVCAGIIEMRVKLQLQSLRISIESENACSLDDVNNAHRQIQRAALGEILSDCLSIFACFPPPFSQTATNEAKIIALDRMSSMGLSTREAAQCMSFIVETFVEKLDVAEVSSTVLRKNKASKAMRFESKDQTIEIGESESILDDLIESTVQEAIDFVSNLMPRNINEWKKALIIDISSGLQFDAERYFYDWKIIGNLKSLSLKNGGGRQLLLLCPEDASDEDINIVPDTSIDDHHLGLQFTVSQNDEGFTLGEGGFSFEALSHDVNTNPIMRQEMSMQASIGSLRIQFSDCDWTNAIETISVFKDRFSSSGDEIDQSAEKEKVLPIASISTSFDISNFQFLLCTDEFQPFSKAVINNLSTDIVSSHLLLEENKKMQIVARGHAVYLFDLSPEGQIFDDVLIPLKNANSPDASFEVRMIQSNDQYQYPSELLIVFTNVRVFFLRRFLTEMLQFFLSPQCGFGHFLSIHASPKLNETIRPHPLSFQVCFLESSIICPKDSSSDELIAFRSSKIILTSSYENESFSISSISRDDLVPEEEAVNDSNSPFDPGVEFDDSKKFDGLELRSDSLIFVNSNDASYESFNPNSIMRINISAENVQVFTGISEDSPQKRHEAYLKEDFYYISRYLDVGDIVDGSEVYNMLHVLPEHLFVERDRLEHLCSRMWEEVTEQPVQFEVYADFLSSGLRILIKDQIVFDDDDCAEPTPFDIKLRMSQFYAILSMWYGNMQELPILFPYSMQSIWDAIVVPPCPHDWPEYGTDSYVHKVNSNENKRFEIVVSFEKLQWLCSFDHPDYFSKKLGCSYMIDYFTDKISMKAEGFFLKADTNHENTLRVTSVSRSLLIQDLRPGINTFGKSAIHIPHSPRQSKTGRISMEWGLGRSMADFTDDLNFPFQVSVIMTPDRWCLANIGLAGLDSCSHDLGFFWILLEYFSAYFVSHEFGNPYFQAERKRSDFLKHYDESGFQSDSPCLNLDVRLWLTQPCVILPEKSIGQCSQMLVLKTQSTGGVFYRYKSIGRDFYSQNVFTKNMDILSYGDTLGIAATLVRKLKKSDRNTQFITIGLNLSVQYDMHLDSNHMNLFVSTAIPDHLNDVLDGIESTQSQVQPLLLPPPKVCHPRFRFSAKKRGVSSSTCDIIISPEHLHMAGKLLSNFAGPYLPEDEKRNLESTDQQKVEPNTEFSFSVTSKMSCIRLVICEPTLGMHSPIANMCISELRCTVSDFKFDESMNTQKENMDFQACADAQFNVDYYKSGPTRSWEPLLEPYKCTILYEKSTHRGLGITLNSETPFHLNLSGAFLETFDFATRSSFSPFSSMFKVFQKDSLPITPMSASKQDLKHGLPKTEDISEDIPTVLGDTIPVSHQRVPILSSHERVAFSLINLSGDRLRFHQQNRATGKIPLSYIDHLGETALSFPATSSVFRNLKVVEISSESQEDIEGASDAQFDSSHFIDFQVPGMYWSRAICVDKPGKRFINLRPRSDLIMTKLKQDWRLPNVLSILAEVSSFEGGRKLMLSSPIEVVNKTRHKIELAFHTDPKHFDKISSDENEIQDNNTNKSSNLQCDIQGVEPGQTYQVPILLLEAALRGSGKNLGDVWLRPQEKDDLEFLNALRGKNCTESSGVSIGFCSRSIAISNLVEESSKLFKEYPSSLSELNTEYHLFCPIIEDSKELISPLCYCIEVKRSPVVAPFPGHGMFDFSGEDDPESKEIPFGPDSLAEEKSVASSVKKRKAHVPTSSPDEKNHNHVHGPIAYSLVIHPPIVIENLLPEPARYEIMHVTKRQVVWWSILKPGESIPIHTVGLDSQLVMMINVGYCRTPVGEGALIHNGSDIIKRLQGQDKITASIDRLRSDESFHDTTIDHSETKPEFDKTKASGAHHGSYDLIATTTTVVDSIGQRLNLHIDNKKGAGGQRHITVSCPYWIVNTTEYALRYKQDKSMNFVSGTIKSARKDGSKPVDSSKRNSIIDDSFQKTIFPGQPGALFGAKDKFGEDYLDQYTTLLGMDIPLEQIANIAFMFNYGGSHRFGGNERFSIKLTDPYWRSDRCSEWSRGFSLDSVGVTQVVGMHCADGRQLEVAAVVAVAPGVLSKYTKIVRICPRYVLINQLTRPIRLWQDSSLVHPSRVLDASKDASRGREHPNWRPKPSSSKGNDILDADLALCQYDFLFGQPTPLDYQPDTNMPKKTVAHASAFYITTAACGDPIPFHLPDTRADRELRIDLGPNWNLSASFPADIISDYTLKLNRVVDLRLLKHVDNRGASKYKVQLPHTDTSGVDIDFDGELGLWFETIQWNGSSKCVVKGTKRDKFSFNNTDIHVGDELLAIDGKLVSKMEFGETMKLLKDRLTEVADACKIKKQKDQKAVKNNQKVRKPKFLKRFDRSGSHSTIDTDFVGPVASRGDDSIELERPLTLEFQTLEYRMKRVRDRALRRRKDGVSGRKRHDNDDENTKMSNKDVDSERLSQKIAPGDAHSQNKFGKDVQLEVSTKLINLSVFVFVNEARGVTPYRIENRSMKKFIHFRQRACENHPWNALAPGESFNYTWEEPLKPCKLVVRVGNQGIQKGKGKSESSKLFPFKLIESEDQGGFGPSKIVKLDEVGLEGVLPCFDGSNQRQRDLLFCSVDTDGPTRVLIVSDTNRHESSDNITGSSRFTMELQHLHKHINTLTREIDTEIKTLRARKEKRLIFQKSLASKEPDTIQKSSSQLLPTVQEDAEALRWNDNSLQDADLNSHTDHYEDTIITRNHQIIVEVIEASGLQTANNSALTGLCSPFCSVRLEDRSKSLRRNVFKRDTDVKRTYFIERCSSPKWTGMKFVFDVPPSAVSDPHGFAILVKVKDRRFVGRDRPLGRTEIHLRNFKNQKEVIGWFPLLSRTGRGSDLANPAAAGRVQGSVKLRAQWIYTGPALLDYYIILSEHRIIELKAKRDSIKEYCAKMQAEEKKQKELKDDFFNIPSLSMRTNPRLRGTNAQLKSSEGGWTSAIKQGMRAPKLRHLWKRQPLEMTSPKSSEISPIKRMGILQSTHDTPSLDDGVTNSTLDGKTLSLGSTKNFQAFDSVADGQPFQHMNSPLPLLVQKRGHTFSEGDLLKDFMSHDSGSQASSLHFSVDGRFSDHEIRIFEALRSSNILKHRSSDSFHHYHMENMVFTQREVIALNSTFETNLVSWVNAYDVLNDEKLKRRFIPKSEWHRYVKKKVKKLLEVPNNAPFKPLDLPQIAPSFMKKRNIKFREQLLNSREYFDKAAQRSLMAVLNPGGWLKLRPITALCLREDQKNKFTGMYVKVRYGSKSRSTSTVDAKVTPTWTDDIEGRAFDLNQESFFNRHENDLEVKIEPLKTSGALKLSVFGTRINSSSVELGVLQIPLAHAISCCTEASENEKHSGANDNMTGMYVRWFPLKNPKNCVEGDGQVCYRPTDVEQTSDDRFINYMTPCIKLAMWWEPDAQIKAPENAGDKVFGEEQASVATDQSSRFLSERYFHASIDSVSAALIDSFKARELLSLTTTDTDIRYSHTKSTTQVGMAMAHVQLDQHIEKSLEPVVLYPRPVPNPQPTIQFLAIKNNIRSKSNLDSFKHIAIALEEMDMLIEETWMFDVWEFFGRFLRRHHATNLKKTTSHSVPPCFGEESDQSIKINDILTMMKVAHQNALGNDQQKSKQIYIEKLMVAPVKFNISYIKSARITENLLQNGIVTISQGIYGPSIRNKRGNEENIDPSKLGRKEIFRQWSESGHDEDWSTTADERTRNFQNVISAAFPAITNAPIRVNGKVLDNVFKTWDNIISELQSYYVKEMMFQFYKMLGSVDVFGNPTMAVNSIMKGAHDFVVLPFREFIRSPNNPSKLGIGVAKGTLSFLSHFFSGVFGFVSNISEAGGTAAAALSFDEHFKGWHKQQVADHFRHMHGQFRPKGRELILAAIARPLQDLVAGLLFAASGVIVEPYKGAQLKGMAGFTKGIGVGTVGLVAKPLVGVFDAFAHMSESMHDFARAANILDKKPTAVKKMRLPYVFGLHKILLPYNSVNAASANLLRLFPLKHEKRSESEDGEVLITSQLLNRGAGLGWYIVVTTKRIVKFIVHFDGSVPPEMEWHLQLSNEIQINSSIEHCTHSDVLLQIRMTPAIPRRFNTSSSKSRSDSTNGGKIVKNSSEEFSERSKFESLNQSESFLSRKERTNPVQHALGAFGTNKTKKMEKTTYYVAGDLQTERDALIQIHNAVCCLTGQFDSILSRTYSNNTVANNDREGHTSFGPLHFDKKYETSTAHFNRKYNLSDNLDSIPWIYSFNDGLKNRSQWEFHDELQASRTMRDGPEWIVEARARATFQSTVLSSMPTLVDKFEEQWLAENAETEKVLCIDTAEPLISSRHNQLMNRDSDIAYKCQTIDEVANRSVLFEDEDLSMMESKDITIEDRLDNVENMLQRLIQGQTNLYSATGELTYNQHGSACPPLSNVSTVSALTEHVHGHNPVFRTPAPADETELLRREVNDLKKLLAEKDKERSSPTNGSGSKRKLKFFQRLRG